MSNSSGNKKIPKMPSQKGVSAQNSKTSNTHAKISPAKAAAAALQNKASKVESLSSHPVSEPASHPIAADPASKTKRWSFIQNDLEKALDTWEELEKSQSTLSPEEEQLQKIKTIIGQLKDKLNQF